MTRKKRETSSVSLIFLKKDNFYIKTSKYFRKMTDKLNNSLKKWYNIEKCRVT